MFWTEKGTRRGEEKGADNRPSESAKLYDSTEEV